MQISRQRAASPRSPTEDSIHLAFFSEFDSLAQQVYYHLTQSARIADERIRHFRADPAGQLQLLLVRAQSQALDRLVEAVPETEKQRLELELTGFDLGKIQDAAPMLFRCARLLTR